MSAILITHFYSQIMMWTFSSTQKIVVKIFFFEIKPKQDFFENCEHHFLEIEKDFPKTTNLIWFRTIGALRSVKGIVKLGAVWK